MNFFNILIDKMNYLLHFQKEVILLILFLKEVYKTHKKYKQKRNVKMNITYLTFVTFISIMTVLYTFRCKRTEFKFKLSAAGMAIVNIAIVYIHNIAQIDRLTTISEITFTVTAFPAIL